MKKWKTLHKHRTQDSELRTNKIISLILENRGIKTKQDIEEFLQPNLNNVTIKSLQIDQEEVKKALQRIKKAITDQESIVVYTDYDADGISAGAVMWETLHRLGAKVMPYVPHRVEEGYGLSIKGIDEVKRSQNATLIITVDHGISAYEKIDYAKGLGIDVIVTDHHLLPAQPPNSLSTIHTTHLSGTGVAWILCRELVQAMNPSLWSETTNLDLVAFATVADLVPLTKFNRTLVKVGLKKLNQTTRVGLRALSEEAGLGLGNLGTYEIGHVLAPRINAMGRIDSAMDSLRLLCTNDVVKAHRLAQTLGNKNKERQQLTESTLLHALEHAKQHFSDKHPLSSNQKLLFIEDETYNQGIIGLVAGKLVEQYYRPAIVVSKGKEYSKASARSIAGFNIVAALRQCTDLLVDCGGHPMAAGFTLETKQIDHLKQRLQGIAQAEISDDQLIREILIDCELSSECIGWELVEKLSELEPFGIGNPQPIFSLTNMHIQDARLIGANKNHLKLRLDGMDTVDVLGFGLGNLYAQLSPQIPIDIAFTVHKDLWNNQKKLQIKLKDVRIP